MLRKAGTCEKGQAVARRAQSQSSALRENQINKQNFTELRECKIFVLKACYLHNNCCRALFIGLNARPFRVHFPKLFSSALRDGNWVPSKGRNHSPDFTFSFNAH